ncbi:MAG: single-stranded DNA-binding protein [Bacteroidota bacterium]
MINRVTLIGNLGRDPEVRRLENGIAVAKFSVATNENYKDKSGEWQTQTEWHEVVCWRMLAERAERDLKKGKLVYVDGKLTHRKYQDKEGNDRRITEIVANTYRLLEKRESSGSNFPTTEYTPTTTTPTTNTSTVAEKTSTNDQTTAAIDDDLPF